MLEGKKTYLAAAAMVALAVAEALGYAVPTSAWILLNALGLGSLRNAIGK